MLGNELADILREVNPMIVKNFNSPHDVDIKADESIVTKTDQEVEQILTSKLKELLPESLVIGEESAAEGNGDVDSYFQSEYLWAVDPIDGTSNFASGIPFFTVSVGLLKRNENGYSAISGAISFPVFSEVYFTKQNKTFLKNFLTNKETEIRRMNNESVSTFLVPNHFRIHENQLSINIRQLGSTAGDFLYVSIGKATATVTIAHLWDFAAALAIAKTQDLVAHELNTGRIKEFFLKDDFSYGDPKLHWRIKEPIVLCRDEVFRDVQELLLSV